MREGRRIACSAGLLALLLVLGKARGAQAQEATWPDVGAPQQGTSSAEGARDAALLVGVEDYAFVPDVEGASTNINAWYTWLRQARGVPLRQLRLLRDAQATREELLTSIEEAAQLVQPGGTLWIVFIGHGAPAADGRDGLLIGADAQQQPRSLEARSVRQHELISRALKGRQGRTVAVWDACFSGRDRSGGTLIPGLQPVVPVQEQAPGEGVVIFTAASSDHYAGALPGASRPAFSYLMLGALRGWADANNDRAVSAAEALDYTQLVLDALLVGRRQRPEVRALDLQAPLVSAVAERGPDLDALRLGLGAAPRAAASPLAPSGAMVRIEAGEPGDRFEASLLTSDGATLRCLAPVTTAQPCVLQGVAPGQARLNVEGDTALSERLEISSGATLVQLHDNPRWGYGLGGALLGVGMFGYIGSFLGLADCAADCGGWIGGLVGSGVSLFTGVGFLSWALWRDLSTDFSELELRSIPQLPRSSSHPALSPSSQGLGFEIEGRW